ncbi:MAG: hypothetical protein RJA10_456 [Pseudomonadota bacterium]
MTTRDAAPVDTPSVGLVRRQAGLRWRALLGLTAVVAAVHLMLASRVAESALDLQDSAAGPALKRLRAVFVAELRPVAPPEAAARVVAPAPAVRAGVARPAQVASAPAAPASTPTAARAAGEVEPASSAPAPAAAPPAEPSTLVMLETQAQPPMAAASAPAALAVPVDWPRSTQLTYTLSGFFRGPVDGRATVQWLREGSRYQVHLEVSVGSSFAPLVSRRMSSDGDIGPDGLTPRRYEEETRVAFRDPRRLSVQFDGPLVRLANGSEVPRPARVQDTASQFVQLTWLFTTQPERLRPGQSVDLMLALPRRVEPWTYDVLDAETLHTPVGPIDAVHVRPRRPARSGDLTAEMWTAPSLQYLPVRIVIRQDADNWVDLLLERLPVQAAEAAPR